MILFSILLIKDAAKSQALSSNLCIRSWGLHPSSRAVLTLRVPVEMKSLTQLELFILRRALCRQISIPS